MMNKSVALFVLALGVSAASHASYELALMVAGTRVLRYDPVSHVGLGTFADSALGLYGGPAITLDPSRPGQMAALNYDGGVRRFDYSTGQATAAFSVGHQFFGNDVLNITGLSNGNFVVNGYIGGGSGQSSRLYSPTGTQLADMLPFGTVYSCVASTQGTDGNIYSINRFQNSGSSFSFYTFVYNSAGSYLGFNSLGSTTSAQSYGSISSTGNKIIVGPGTGNSAPDFRSCPLGIGQTFTSISGSYVFTSGWTNMVKGHDGRVHVVQSIQSGAVYANHWVTFDPINGYMSENHIMPSTENITSIALVVAPEPGSLLALGLGGMLLLKRRK